VHVYFLIWFGITEVIATDIPTMESLKIRSTAEEKQSDPSLPPTTRSESKLQRDEWMLLPPSIPDVPAPTSAPKRPNVDFDESLTDSYGEPSSNTRNAGGGVDFFSSLGTDHKKKQPEKPNPDKVRFIL